MLRCSHRFVHGSPDAPWLMVCNLNRICVKSTARESGSCKGKCCDLSGSVTSLSTTVFLPDVLASEATEKNEPLLSIAYMYTDQG